MRRYILFVTVPIAIFLAVSIPLTLFFEPLNGDLTRIGGYAESDFGWNTIPPSVPIQSNEQQSASSDVLLLGDSFSAENIWQSQLSNSTGLRVQSFSYVGTCIEDWIEYALRQPAPFVVIETVERYFVNRFENLHKCNSARFTPIQVLSGRSLTSRPHSSLELHLKQTWRTAFNTIRMNVMPQEVVRGDVINAPLRKGCARFSNRRSDRLLFYPEDEGKLTWSKESQKQAIANVLLLQQRLASHGKKLVFVVVPDKLSVYLPCLLNYSKRRELEKVNISRTLVTVGVNTIDLTILLRRDAAEIVDLYKPNDTHFSTNGYIRFAALISPLFIKNTPAFSNSK